jgi:hypothetical protein
MESSAHTTTIDSEIVDENWVTADPEIINKIYIAADSEIVSDDWVIFGFILSLDKV